MESFSWASKAIRHAWMYLWWLNWTFCLNLVECPFRTYLMQTYKKKLPRKQRKKKIILPGEIYFKRFSLNPSPQLRKPELLFTWRLKKILGGKKADYMQINSVSGLFYLCVMGADSPFGLLNTGFSNVSVYLFWPILCCAPWGGPLLGKELSWQKQRMNTTFRFSLVYIAHLDCTQNPVSKSTGPSRNKAACMLCNPTHK